MEDAKKPTTGKKKVIRRLVKNAKTGEIIKTEIVRIDSSGETTVTSYPAGTQVPSLSSLQSSGVKKLTRKASIDCKPTALPAKNSSKENDQLSKEVERLQIPSPRVQVKTEPPSTVDIGPSVPVNISGLEDLLKKEEEMRKMSESASGDLENTKSKAGEESLEAALITMMRKKRQKGPKAHWKGGLVASTIPRKYIDDEQAQVDDSTEDTDYRGSKREDEDEESEKRRKQRHRRRKEKKNKDKTQATNDDIEEYQGETGPLNLPEIESRKRPPETAAEESAEIAADERDDANLADEMEKSTIQDKSNEDLPVNDEGDSDSGSDEDRKKKKKKHKHKKKKKKVKKQKRHQNEEKIDDKPEEKMEEIRKSRSPSRTRSLSSVSLSSISSAFSDSFDFAGMNFDPSEDGGFDMALMEYQQVKEQVFSGSFRGRGGFNNFFRGRGAFRGFPGNHGFMFPPWRGPGPMFQFFQPDPNFMQPGFPGGPDNDPDKGRGRGLPANQGPWRGRGLRGRGIPPGFHRNYTEDDKGEAVYYESDTSGSSSSGRKKKKKKQRRRSYSSSSYSYSSDSSRSRSRRRHRRRHRSSSYSSGSYSRSSYSRSRSDSRSRSRSSRSRSSYSRGSARRSRSLSGSRSRSFKSRSASRGPPAHWGSGDGRASPSYHAYDEDGFKPPVRDKDSDDEEVPWWAEFDKTYEVEKKKLEEEKTKLEEQEREIVKDRTKSKETLPTVLSTDEIDVVQCVMSLVDKARAQQDETMEAARDCINHIIMKISADTALTSALSGDTEESFTKTAEQCMQSILDRVCPDDPHTAARICLKEIVDTVVEQEEEDKANEIATEMEKKITESKDSRLFECYLKAQKLTEQMKADRSSKSLIEAAKSQESNEAGGDVRKKDRRSQRSRYQRRSRSRSRDRGRRRRRHSSSDSSSSSRSHDTRTLVSKESLQQAQALLTLQQQQLQVAGLLGTGMPNLAGLTQAAALAAGLTPTLLAQTGLTTSDLPVLIGDKPAEKDSKVMPRYEKDKDTSKRDDLTRKLMQRMRDKKLKQEEEDGPAFQSRKDKATDGPDKVFTGGLLKSRKIAISSSFGKLWTKVDGSPRYDDSLELTEEQRASLNADGGQDLEKLKLAEQESRLASWSEQQSKLKEEAQREMREQIERAERAKKDKIKEEMLEEERQKEIMRIREEVRSQIRKEIQDEIEKQRKSVLEDPGMREKLLQLEALRNQSGMLAVSSVGGSMPTSTMANTISNSLPTMPMGGQVKDQRWFQQQMKNKQDMENWMEARGYITAELDENTLKMAQMTYMQNWTASQRQAYMQWYWQSKQYPGPQGYQQMGIAGQRPNPSNIPVHPHTVPTSSHNFQKFQAGARFTHPRGQVPDHHGPMLGHKAPFPQRMPYSLDQSRRPPPYNQNMQQAMQGFPDHHYKHGFPQHGVEKQTFGREEYAPRDNIMPGATGMLPHDQRAPGQQSLVGVVNNKPIQQAHPDANMPGQGIAGVEQHPLHQYPPPGLEDEDKVAESSQLQAANEQPLPPGEVEVATGNMVDEMPSTSKSKKRKKKKKHKKKKYSSSDDEDEDENDPEAEKAAILAKLENLRDVEDGEIASDGNQGGGKAAKKKKKSKKEKRKHRRRTADSEDDPSALPAMMVPPPMVPTLNPEIPVGFGGPGHFPNREFRDERAYMHFRRDQGGAGEPQPVLSFQRLGNPPMGPGGDHIHAPRKRSPSPLPVGVPSDPLEFEMWQRKMEARYHKEAGRADGRPPAGQQFVPDGEGIRIRVGGRDPMDGPNDDVAMMMRMMDREEKRREPSPYALRGMGRDDRKRRTAAPHRGRRKQRRVMIRKNYHDWDKPNDDGLIYCLSGSDSSGGGSDANLDFDKMLARKRKEAGNERAMMSPLHNQTHSPARIGWDRREISHNENLFQSAEKPQGIPVIGGGPRPIPTNVSMSRGPSRHDMIPAPEFTTPHDIVKLSPAMQPMGYHQDSHFEQRREQAFLPPPPMPMVAHPIPRLGSQSVASLPPPPIMMNLTTQQHHPMNYGRQRFRM